MNRLPIDLCLPLMKYSYAEADTAQDPIIWNHYTAVGLCVLLRGDNDGHGALQMDIIEKTTTKETVDLAHHIDIANASRRNAKQPGLSIKIEQLPIFGITRDVLLALRFRTSTGRARRIQLRLQDATQCNEVVSILKHRGLIFQDQRPTSSRLSTAVAVHDAPMSETRPLTSPHKSTQAVGSQHSQSPFHPPSMALGSLGQASQSARRMVHCDNTTRHRADDMLPGPTLTGLTRDRLAALDYASRPLSAGLSSPFAAPRTAPDLITRQVNSSDGASQSRTEPPRSVLGTAFASQQGSSDTVGPPPWTASSSNSVPLAARETAAPEPDLSRHHFPVGSANATKPSSRPSSALELPPLQTPRIAKAQATSASEKSLFDVPKLQESQSHGARASTEIEARQNSSYGAQPAVLSSNTRPQSAIGSSSEQAMTSRHIMPEHRSQKCSPRLNSLMDAPHELESDYEGGEAPGFSQQHTQAPAGSLNDQPILRHDFFRGATADIDQGDLLSRYAAQRPQDREAALNKFMMDRLADPAFATLCADVENCWRRIALGL
ncbi:hypothetical protein Slin14017_G014610 [Septoria linicola]|nr:hypothetical protein Slin14017_G014610 [Septoria linicola]